MFTLLVILHVIFCVFLILVILLQTGKGAGIGAAFGGASQTVFGPRGAGSFIGKLTAIVAALFMITSLVLAYLSSSGSSGIESKANALKDDVSTEVEEVDLGQKAPANDTSGKENALSDRADGGVADKATPAEGLPAPVAPATAPKPAPEPADGDKSEAPGE